MQWRTVMTVAILGVLSAFLGVSCTALLDWHLHDTEVEIEDKKISIEGEPGGDPTSSRPSEDIGTTEPAKEIE